LDYGTIKEWIIYSVVGTASYVMLGFAKANISDSGTLIITMLYILFNFFVLCFAIIRTSEKTKKEAEAEFAQNLISSAQEHYQQMNALYDKLRILRHDYKYHLNVLQGMLNSKDEEGLLEAADSYLSEMKAQFSHIELRKFCSNSVINALISDYYERIIDLNAQRCMDLHIPFDVQIEAISNNVTISDYDLCIIIGNLLENAIEGVSKVQEKPFITLKAHITGNRLLIKTENSFNNSINSSIQKEQNSSKTFIPASTKNGDSRISGLGLKSVQEVINRYSGDLLTEWNEKTFTVFAAIEITKENHIKK
jgi:sensor histidine kinase regulating citrate/malate metabolism